jgi:hypothetical protein
LIMKRVVLALFISVLALPAWALPTIDAVQGEISKGRYSQAEDMLREVITAKPSSARAHYVYAEVLAHDKRFDKAAEEAALARKLDPEIRFTQPEKFNAFLQLLDREQAAARAVVPTQRETLPEAAPVRQERALPAHESSTGGVPIWVWGLAAAALAFVAWRAFAARQPAPTDGASGRGMSAVNPGWAGGPGYPVQPAGYAPGYGPGVGGYPPGTTMPSRNGLLGTGLAVAGGVAAGMLAEKLFEGHREIPTQASDVSAGGLTPGLFDDPSPGNAAARELEQRPIDFGTDTSGDGWSGSDNADMGSSSSDDGW